MKIGVNALFMIPGEVGGTETYLRKTLESAVRLHPQHEFVVFTNAENRQVLARDLVALPNVTLVDMRIRAMSRARRLLCEQFTLPRIVKDNGIEVLWNPGSVASMWMKCPQVTTICDMQYCRFPEDYSRFGLFVMKCVTCMTLRKSRAIITISEFSRQEIVKFSKVPFNRVSVTPLAADCGFAERQASDFVAERVIVLTRSSDPYILMVSNTYPHKSMATGVRAFAKLANELGHRLVVVGKPRRGEAEVEAALAELPEGRAVRIQYVMSQDLLALYQGAELFVFPSRYEGFGLPVLEAMHAGLPVVTTREGSIPEVGGEAVAYAAAGDVNAFAGAMKSCLTMDAATRKAWIARARERAERFSWEETAKKTVAELASAACSQ